MEHVLRHCHVGRRGSGSSTEKRNLNAASYKGILDNSALPSLWKSFGEGPHKDEGQVPVQCIHLHVLQYGLSSAIIDLHGHATGSGDNSRICWNTVEEKM